MSGSCRGGYCCQGETPPANLNDPKVWLFKGCTACNTRGLCRTCDTGYTLCGQTSADQGQCAPIINFADGTNSDQYKHSWICGGEAQWNTDHGIAASCNR